MSASKTQPTREEEAASDDVQALASVIEYFDTHDLGDELESMPEVQFEVAISPRLDYYSVEADLSRRLRALAKRRGVSAETLLNLWVQEKVMQAAPIAAE